MEKSLLEREKELNVLNDSLNMHCETSLQPMKKRLDEKLKKIEILNSSFVGDHRKLIQDEPTKKVKEVNKVNRMIPDNLIRRNVSTEGVIRFLKSKVTILQQELTINQKKLSKCANELADKSENIKKLKSLQLKHEQEITALKDELNKIVEQKNSSYTKLNMNLSLTNQIRKKNDEYEGKLNKAQNKIKSIEIEFVKCQEDLQCVRENFYTLKSKSKNVENDLHKEIKCYENQIKVYRKQRESIVIAFKKQLILIENLKKQNICLEQTNLLQQTRVEFSKCLNWSQDKNAM